MRPKLLEIEGLQSFCDNQTIDFAALGETGLFGIFGPTGSGKSTILDAVTLALYGDVKRAKSGTQGIINTNRKTVRVSFSFELSRDGARKNYRVERVYQRKKGSENACEAKIARLIEITDAGEIPLCDKANDVTNTVQELLGLNQIDFTRAVVLPQNSFQEFLLLGNSERRGMLERIFYLEEYGRELWEKLNRRMTGMNNRIMNLSGELKGYEDASVEALEKVKIAAEEAAVERDSALNGFKRQEALYVEAKAVWELVQDLSLINDKERRHFSVKDTVLEKKSKLERAIKAEGLIELIKNRRDLKDKLEKTKKELDETEANLPLAQARLDKTRRNQEKLKEEISIEQPKLVERKARLQDALGVKGEIATLDKRLNGLNAEAEKLRNEISVKAGLLKTEAEECEKLEKDLSKLKTEAEAIKIAPEYRKRIQEGSRLEGEAEAQAKNVKDIEQKAESLKKNIASVEQELNGIRDKIDATQKLLNQADEEKKKHDGKTPGDKKELQGKLDRLHGLQTAYDVLCIRKSELDDIEGKLKKQQADLEFSAVKAKSLKEAREKAALRFEACRQELETAQGELDKNAAHRLSKTLKEGEPCPVCGSEHHPGPALQCDDSDVSALERQIERVREDLSNAEKMLKEAERVSLVADEQVRTLTAQNSETKEEYGRKATVYSSDKNKLPEALKNLELEAVNHELERMNQTATEKLSAIEVWEKEQEEFKNKLNEINNSLAGLRITENGKATELKINKDNLENLEKTLEEVKNSSDEVRRKYSAFLEEFTLKSATEELARLSETDRHLDELQGIIAKTQKSAEGMRTLREEQKEDLQKLNNGNIKLEAEINHLSDQKKALEAGISKLAGEVPIEDEIKLIEGKLSEYHSRGKQIQESLQLIEKRVRELEDGFSILKNRKTIYGDNLRNEEARLEAALAERGFTGADEAEGSVLSQVEQKAMKLEIETYDQEGFNIQAQKAMICKKLDSREISEGEWIKISSVYGEIAAHKDECVAKSGIAASKYEDVKIKHDRWVGINRDYQEITHKQGLFEQIKKLLGAGKGSFIDYIAEERLHYVAAKASDTLGVMTRYKYALELDTENGFIIRDNANGGAHRPVTSLSGGETFLTSLSLALALSDQIQLKGQSPLEFFFLDEGFGTLDNSLLDSVMDSLERLSRTDRVIGLISHVPELRGRLARRLVVDAPTAQGEGSRVRVEKG